MKTLEPGYVAISDDILKKHKWSPGSKIYIEGIGIYTIADRMSKRIKGNVLDIYIPTSKKDALKFGRKIRRLVCLMK